MAGSVNSGALSPTLTFPRDSLAYALLVLVVFKATTEVTIAPIISRLFVVVVVVVVATPSSFVFFLAAETTKLRVVVTFIFFWKDDDDDDDFAPRKSEDIKREFNKDDFGGTPRDDDDAFILFAFITRVRRVRARDESDDASLDAFFLGGKTLNSSEKK